MKKLLITAAATAILATNISVMNSAQAANSSHCNSLDHGVQFNKTELSAFDKCWLDTHKADEKSGVSGNVFWVKIDGKYISMPVKTLSQAGSKAKAKEIVKEKIIKEVIVEKIVERVTVDTAEIDRLNARIDILAPLADQVPGLRAEIGRLGVQIFNLQAANLRQFDLGIAQGTADTHEALKNGFNTRFGTNFETAREAFLATSYVNQRTGINVFDISGASAGVYYNRTYVNDAVANALVGVETLSKYRARNAIAGSFNVRNTTVATPLPTEGLADYIQRAVSLELTKLPAPTSNGAMPNSNPSDHTDEHGDASIDAAEHMNNLNSVTKGGYERSRWHSGSAYYHVTGTRVNGNSLYINTGTFATFDQALNELVEQAYDEGYSDGYEDGYNDGYAAGYADGIASVQ